MKNYLQVRNPDSHDVGVSVCGFSAVKPENLVRGVVGPVTANTSWAGYSNLALIPGAALIPVTSTQTVFYLGSRWPRRTSTIWSSNYGARQLRSPQLHQSSSAASPIPPSIWSTRPSVR